MTQMSFDPHKENFDLDTQKSVLICNFLVILDKRLIYIWTIMCLKDKKLVWYV